MAIGKKTSIYIPQWVSQLYAEMGVTDVKADHLMGTVRTAYLPQKWGLDGAFVSYYEGNYDIRRLLTDCIGVIAAPAYENVPDFGADAQDVLNIVINFISRSGWKDSFDGTTGDYDPTNQDKWLSNLYEWYHVVNRESDLYLSFVNEFGEESADAFWNSRSGFSWNKTDVNKRELYENLYKRIKEEVRIKYLPAHYVRVIAENWDFYKRTQSKAYTELEYCLFCSNTISAPMSLVRVLREKMKYISDNYPEKLS